MPLWEVFSVIQFHYIIMMLRVKCRKITYINCDISNALYMRHFCKPFQSSFCQYWQRQNYRWISKFESQFIPERNYFHTFRFMRMFNQNIKKYLVSRSEPNKSSNNILGMELRGPRFIVRISPIYSCIIDKISWINPLRWVFWTRLE